MWVKTGQIETYLARGAWFFAVDMDTAAFDNIIRKVSQPNPGMYPMIHFGKLDMSAFAPPLPVGVVPVQLAFDVHFDTFVRVFGAYIRDGMRGTPDMAVGRVDALLAELGRVADALWAYCACHFAAFKAREADVNAHFKEDANQDWADFAGTISDEAWDLRQINHFAPPTLGTVGSIRHPQLVRLSLLTAEGSGNSMEGLLSGGLVRQQSANATANPPKRKATPSAAPNRPPPAATAPEPTAFCQNIQA